LLPQKNLKHTARYGEVNKVNIPKNLIFTTKFNDSLILITIISCIFRWRMQGLLNSIIDPRAKQCTGALPTQPLGGIKM
jgi:hypothetical protein